MTEQSKVSLYTYPTSPYGSKVYWALIYKKISFDIVYVNPFNQKELKHTGQKIVPVLKVGDEWRLDSTPLCLWLDELYPTPGFTGIDEQEKQAIKQADDWVTNNLIPLAFRVFVDKGMRAEAFKLGRDLVHTYRKTPTPMPWVLQFVWSGILSQVGFIKREAARTDLTKSFQEVRQEMVDHLDTVLSKNDFLAGTQHPSYADIAAFSRFAAAQYNGSSALITPTTTPAIQSWFNRIIAAMPERLEPEMIPGWMPYTGSD